MTTYPTFALSRRATLAVRLGGLPAFLAYLLSWYYDGGRMPLLIGTALILLLWTAGAGINRWASGTRLPGGVLPIFMLVWFTWFGLTVAWSTVPYTSWFYAWILGSLPLAFLGWTLSYTGKDPDQAEIAWQTLRTGIFGAALVLVGWAGYQYWHWLQIGMSPAGLRPYGPLLDTNSFSAWMNLLFFPMFFVWFATSEKALQTSDRHLAWRSYALLVLIGLVLIADFSTDSRGGLLSGLCTWPLAIWALHRRPHAWRKIGVVFGMGALAFAAFQWSRNFDLIGHLAPSFITHNVSTVSRWLMWKATWAMYLAHPWVGTGLGSYFLYYPAYRLPAELASAGTYAHNDYLQYLAEGGPLNLAFLLIFAVLLCWLLWRLVRGHQVDPNTLMPARITDQEMRRLEAIGLVLGVFAITGHALGNFIFYNLPLSLLAGLFLARAWMVLAPTTAVVPAPRMSRRFLAMGITALVLVLPLKNLLCDLAANTLMSPSFVTTFLPAGARFPVMWNTARILAQLRTLDPAPHLFLASVYTSEARLPAQTIQDRRLDLERALIQYHSALQGIPLEAPVYDGMAAIIAQNGPILGLTPKQVNQAVIGDWKKALAINPEMLQTRYEWATWLRMHHQYAAGRDLLRRGFARPLIGNTSQILHAMLAAYQKPRAGTNRVVTQHPVGH